MIGAYWKFVLARSRDLVELGELTQARDRQLSLTLNRPGSLSFSIPMSDELGSQIYPIEYAVKAYRIGSQGLQLVWSGFVNTIEEDALNDRMSVNCVGWFDRLSKRILHEDKLYSALDDALIAKDMLAHANAGLAEGEYPPDTTSAPMPGDLLYSIQWPTGSVPNTPTWLKWGGTLADGPDGPDYAPSLRNEPTLPRFQTVIQSVIQSLSEVENGFDWDIDSATREFFIYRHRRRELADVVFGYRFGPENVAQFNRQIDGSTLANYGLATGMSGLVGQYDADYVSQGYYGPFEEVYSLSEVTGTDAANKLQVYASAEILLKHDPRQLYSITPFNWTQENSVPEPFVDYGIGDQVRFIARQAPRISINQQVRVFGMSVAIDSESNEKLGQLQVSPS